jgi:hypothetical protein
LTAANQIFFRIRIRLKSQCQDETGSWNVTFKRTKANKSIIQNPRVLFKANSNLMNSNLPANHHFGFSGHEPEYFSLGAI